MKEVPPVKNTLSISRAVMPASPSTLSTVSRDAARCRRRSSLRNLPCDGRADVDAAALEAESASSCADSATLARRPRGRAKSRGRSSTISMNSSSGAGFAGVRASSRSSLQVAIALHHRELIPAREVGEVAAWGSAAPCRTSGSSSPCPAAARPRVDDAVIERVARDADAGVAERPAREAPPHARTHHREVAGAAAEIGDQHGRILLQPPRRRTPRPTGS